jgi:aldehyde dehydrogenase (NAD+)
LLAREEGKTLPEGIGEVARAGQIFSFFAGEALRLTGEKGASVRPGLDVEITREAVGVIGLITPWNFPIAIPAWKIAPALCYGNSVVFKPAEIVPGSAHALSEIIARSGIPAGVFNLVMGSGSVVGQHARPAGPAGHLRAFGDAPHHPDRKEQQDHCPGGKI